MTTTAKLFVNGRSQAVRIPKALEFSGVDEVHIRRDGDTLVLTPVRKNWTSFQSLPAADEDFMQERPELMDEDRTIL